MSLKSGIKFGHKAVLILLTFLFALYLQTLPLTNSLDFEFSALMGIWFFIAGGILFLKTKENNGITDFIKKSYLIILVIILIPFLISFVNSAFLHICPFGNGILFFLFVSIISLFLGIIIGALSQEIAAQHPFLLFFLFFFSFIIVSLLEVFFYPQVFTYNPLIGLFPGTVYDELIDFDSKLFFFRVYNIIFFLVFYSALRIMKGKLPLFQQILMRGKVVRAVSSISIVVIFFFIYWIGNLLFCFTFPLSKIESDLGGKLITEHFVLIYPKEIPKEKIEISALHHEFYYNEISNKTGIKPVEKITSILFGSTEQKKKYIGSANADISKPWQNDVITDFANHDLTLEHEIVHAFSSCIGGKVFKASYWFNPALMEGFAVAIVDKEDYSDLYSAAYTIRKFNNKVTVVNLLKGFNFFGQNSSVSYVYSGAFIKWLIEKYGIDKFKQVYTDPNYEKNYSKSLAGLEGEFNVFIDSSSYSYNPNKAILFFAGKPIFLKKCPRYVASVMKKGGDYFSEKNYGKALDLFKEVYSNAESNSALSGIVSSLIKLGRKKEALDFLKVEINKFEKTTSIFSLQIQLADLYVRNDEFEEAVQLYKNIINENPHPEYVFTSLTKLKLSDSGNEILKKYIEADSKNKSSIILNSPDIELMYKVYWLIDYRESDALILDWYNKLESICVKNDLDLYLLFKTSRFLKDKGRFEDAEKVSTIMLRSIPSEKGIVPLLEENQRKINYFIKFGDEIKKKFTYY